MQYNFAAIRELIQDAFTPKELRRFCQDRPIFEPILCQFPSEASLVDMTDLLIDYCERRVLFEDLLSEINTFNPRQYERHQAQLRQGEPSAPDEAEWRSRKRLLLEPVPATSHLIERTEALTAYQKRLHEDRLVIIKGLAGMGKTTLGAALARGEAKREEQIFWFTFDPVDKNTAEALFWALAAFLDNDGKPDLWRFLEGEIGAEKALKKDVKLNLLFTSLASGDYLLCLDDFQQVRDAPDVLDFFGLIERRLQGSRQDVPARFILMGREVPAKMEYLVPAPLGGFTYEEAVAFVKAENIVLSPALMRRLWERTEGNPKFLELGIATLAGMSGDQPAMERFVAAMARRGDIRDYLMTEIYDALMPDERQVAGIVSIFPAAVDRKEVEEVLSAKGLERVASHIDALINESIVNETDDERIVCHDLVREYCYRMLDPAERESLHRQAADYYQQAGDHLAAAYHLFQQGNEGGALELLTGHATAIIQRGEAGALLEQLARFEQPRLKLEQRVALCRARGDAHEMRGEYEKAAADFAAALQEPVTDRDSIELYCKLGTVYRRLGDYRSAMQHFMKSLEASQALQDEAGLAEAYRNVGWTYYRLGRLSEARASFVASQQLALRSGDTLLQANTDLGLGSLDWREGQLEAARKRFEGSRRIFVACGDRRQESLATGNLGLIYGFLGDLNRALACYRQAMQTQEEMGDVYNLYAAYNNLGDLHHKLGDYAQMAHYYGKLAELAQNSGHKPMLCTACVGLADAQLALGNPQQALKYAQDAERIARETGSNIDLGVSYRALGQVYLSLDDAVQARTFFQQSLPLLEEAREDEELARARNGLKQASYQGKDGSSHAQLEEEG